MKIYKKTITYLILIFTVIVISISYNNIDKSTIANSQANKPIYRVKTDEKKVAITIDVNWGENEYIYDILDVLEKNNVKATFFVMGKWVIYPEGNKEKLIKIKEGGHEIGNHSYVHPMFTQISDGRILEELKKTDDIIFEATGEKPKVFRFPSGNYNEKSLEFVEGLGYKCIQWDVDSVDWKELGADIEYNKVIKNINNGSILLFHNNAKYTPKNLEKIILKLKDDGYEFVTIDQLIYSENYYVDENGQQIKK